MTALGTPWFIKWAFPASVPPCETKYWNGILWVEAVSSKNSFIRGNVIIPGSNILNKNPWSKCPNVSFEPVKSSAAEQSTAKNKSGLNFVTLGPVPRNPTSSWTFAPAINVFGKASFFNSRKASNTTVQP